MRRLIISDIHANLPAFEAVLNAAGNFDELIFLGDSVGYGPNPGECINLLMETGATYIVGNHDMEIIKLRQKSKDLDNAPDFWDKWTYSKLSEKQLDYLENALKLYTICNENRKACYIHYIEGKEYLSPNTSDECILNYFETINSDDVFFGHSHHLIDRVINGRHFVCVRAVGQPRDKDPRAGYTIDVDGILTHLRVDYNIEMLIHDLNRIGLSKQFLKRWTAFVKTGYDAEWSRL